MRFRKFLKPYKTRGSSFREHTQKIGGGIQRHSKAAYDLRFRFVDAILISGKCRGSNADLNRQGFLAYLTFFPQKNNSFTNRIHVHNQTFHKVAVAKTLNLYCTF